MERETRLSVRNSRYRRRHTCVQLLEGRERDDSVYSDRKIDTERQRHLERKVEKRRAVERQDEERRGCQKEEEQEERRGMII